MATENNWLTHNLYDRLTNKNSDFDVKINVQNYKSLNFEQATREVCEKLYAINNKIYVGLSGGLDSEYVFKRFHSLKIPFTPVIVYSKCYEEESSIAFNLCREYSIEPKVLTIEEKDILIKHKTIVHGKLNSFGIGSVPAIVMTDYAKENNGIYVKGEHIVGDIDYKVSPELNEWDFYNDVLNDGYTYDFFLYTPEIVYSMVSEMLNTPDVSSQVFKCRLYNIPYRNKIYVNLTKLSWNYFRWLKDNKDYKPIYSWKMKPQEFLERYF